MTSRGSSNNNKPVFWLQDIYTRGHGAGRSTLPVFTTPICRSRQLMARPVRTSVPLEEDELRKRGYYVGAILGEGSYAKVRFWNIIIQL